MSEYAFQPLRTADEWNALTAPDGSTQNPYFYIFKHSHRCPVSITAQRRLQNGKNLLPFPVYEVNVIGDRALSQHISRETGVEHESPQLLLLKGARCLAHCSHNKVDVAHAKEFANQVAI